MIRNKPFALIACAVLISACSSDDKSSDATTAPTDAASSSTATTAADAATTTAAEAASSSTAATIPTDVVNDDPVLIDLNFGGDNFKIGVSTTTFKAGTINFKVSNLGKTPHEFGIARGNSYAELPQLANGSIDEEALGDDFLGKTPIVDRVLSPERDISFDLAPGNYVFFCNLVVGPVSHAARGHVLSVTVVP